MVEKGPLNQLCTFNTTACTTDTPSATVHNGNMTAALRIIDSRTEAEYEVPVYDNYVLAKDLSCIESADGGASKKLRILDNGYEHTACMKSAITHMYVAATSRALILSNAVIPIAMDIVEKFAIGMCQLKSCFATMTLRKCFIFLSGGNSLRKRKK
jgi:hypothetical protein